MGLRESRKFTDEEVRLMSDQELKDQLDKAAGLAVKQITIGVAFIVGMFLVSLVPCLFVRSSQTIERSNPDICGYFCCLLLDWCFFDSLGFEFKRNENQE